VQYGSTVTQVCLINTDYYGRLYAVSFCLNSGSYIILQPMLLYLNINLNLF